MKVLYFINDGEPDTTRPYAGTITFNHNNQMLNLTPTTNNLFIWENGLLCSINPFYSKKNIDCSVLMCNVLVEF